MKKFEDFIFKYNLLIKKLELDNFKTLSKKYNFNVKEIASSVNIERLKNNPIMFNNNDLENLLKQ